MIFNMRSENTSFAMKILTCLCLQKIIIQQSGQFSHMQGHGLLFDEYSIT